jgi:hypothetical protein
MPTMSIQQFRATLQRGSDRGVLVRAYRQLARRPELAMEMRGGEWAAWPAAATRQAA